MRDRAQRTALAAVSEDSHPTRRPATSTLLDGDPWGTYTIAMRLPQREASARSSIPVLTPADIRRLVPAALEFLWRTILSREDGMSYRHVDGGGIDCLIVDTAYRIYHEQGAPWPVVQSRSRDDLHAVQRARAKGLFAFDEYVFVMGWGARA